MSRHGLCFFPRFFFQTIVWSLTAFVELAGGVCLQAETSARSGAPVSEKARKSWDSALEWQKKGFPNLAIDELRAANTQDGGHCTECLRRAYELAIASGAAREATETAREWLAAASSDGERATIHGRIGEALRLEGQTYKKKQLFVQSCDEYKMALALAPTASLLHFGYGLSLATAHREQEARAEFKGFLETDRDHAALRWRAGRYLERIELAREPLAPDFHLTTVDGKELTRDGLAGKVVLIDFWASWCAPCRASIPEISKLVKEFEGRPFVAISVDLDKNEDEWRSAMNRFAMNWPQAGDGGFKGPMAQLFAVRAIPATFSIDADGILEDQRVGDMNLEAKLKKMVAQAEKRTTGKTRR